VEVEGGPGDCRVRFEHGGTRHDVRLNTVWNLGEPLLRGKQDGIPFVVQVERRGIGWRLAHAGAAVEAVVLSRRAAALAAAIPKKAGADTSKYVLSPMPGLLVSLGVKPGQQVRAGEELAVIEAMKMQNILRAEQDGTVKALHARPGESLAVDQAIMEFV
jgi:propionyl-CoA carboxylase alpha chain